MKHKDIVCMF